MIPRIPSLLFLKVAGVLGGCLDEKARTEGGAHRASPRPLPPPSPPPTALPDAGNIPAEGEGPPPISEGEGEGPPEPVLSECAYVEPQSIDFGLVEVGTSRLHEAAIFNCGRAEAYVHSISLEAPDSFTLDALESCDPLRRLCNLNTVIPPAGQLPFQLRYTPQSSDREGGRALIDFKVPEQILGVNFVGLGTMLDIMQPPTAIAQARMLGVGEFREYGDMQQPLRMGAGDTVELKGSDSFDPEGSALRYFWSVVDMPDGGNVVFEPAGSEPDVTTLIARGGQYTFELAVEDADGLLSSARIYLLGMVGSGFSIELSWQSLQGNNQNVADLDLYLFREAENPNERDAVCNFANPNPDWGPPGAANNPQLDRDCNGFVCASENISLNSEESAQYRVGVDYRFVREGTPEARIAFFVGGILRLEMSRILREPGLFWEVARLGENNGIRPIDIIHPQVPLP